jgi:hypothetical protein
MREESNRLIIKSFREIIKAYRVEGTVPSFLKEEVFKTISTIELTSDILDLFIVQFVRSKASMVEEFHFDQKEDGLS